MKADHILEAASRVSEAAELMTLHTVSETASVSSPGGPIRTTLEESSCSIRIVRNGRIGSGASSGRTAGPDLIDQAIALSRIGPEALFSLPGPSEPEPLDTEHPLVLQTGLEDLTGFLIGVETELASRWPRSVVRGPSPEDPWKSPSPTPPGSRGHTGSPSWIWRSRSPSRAAMA